MRTLQHIASFMIYLVLSLLIIIPLQVSAFSVQISGGQGVDGARLATDVTLINASAESPVSILQGDTAYPMSCALQGTNYFCTHIFEKATLPAGEHTLSFSQESGTPEQITKTFIVDDKEPTFREVNITPGSGVLYVNYSVMDTAVQSDPSICSGLKTLELSTETENLFTKNIDSRPCELQDSFTVDAQGLAGTMKFILTATDALGQFKTYYTNEYTVDFKKPDIQNGFTLLFGNKEVTQISAHPEVAPVVDVIVFITEANLSSVQLDLRDLTQDPLLQNEYKNKTASCSQHGLKQECVVSQIQLNPGKAKLSIPIYAKDNYGNIATKIINQTFQLYDKQGVVTYFDPVKKHCDDDGLCFVKQGSVVYKISVEGADAGLAPQLISLATSELADFLPIVHAMTCNQTVNGSWESADCFAYVPVSLESHNLRRRVVLTHPTTDLMGTALTGKLSSIVSIDNEAPINITPLRSTHPCPVAGETNEFYVNVTDSGSTKLRIAAHTENITELDYFEAWCEHDESGTFVCKLPMSGFVSYPEKENLDIYVEDLAGNKLDLTTEAEVCQSETEIEPEFITSITTANTFSVDRRIASQMPIKLYIPLDIQLKSSIARKIDFLDLETNGCVGTELRGGTPYFLNKFDFLEQQGKTANRGQPILVVPFGGLGSDIDIPAKTTINCTIKVYEKKGSLRFVKPEQQKFVVDVQTTNLELGTISDTTTKKLSDLLGEINKMQDKIDSRMKWHKTLKTICNLAGALTMAADILSMVQSAVYLISLLLYAFGQLVKPLHLVAENLWSAVCNSTHWAVKQITSIWPQGKLSTGLGMFVKIGCIVYSCGVCSPGGIASAVSIGVSGVHVLGSGHSGVVSTSNSGAQITKTDGTGTTRTWNPATLSFETNSPSTQAHSSSSTTPSHLGNPSVNSKSTVGTNEQQADLFMNEARARTTAGKTWIIDPYKNINYAKRCLCNPGVIYNYNKNQQLLCRQYNCVKETAEKGLPTTACDAAYDVGSCLYYEGAISERSFFENIGQGLLDMLISSAPYISYRALCKNKGNLQSNTCGPIDDATQAKFVMCDIVGAALTLQDFKGVFKNPYSTGPLEPGGTNFCEGISIGDQT